MMGLFRFRKKKLLIYLLALALFLLLCTAVKQQLDGPIVMVQGGADRDSDVRLKREHVRQMMIHAWKSYVTFAWGKNELKPLSKKAHNLSIFGTEPLGTSFLH